MWGEKLYLVIYEQLGRIVDSLQQDQLIRLAWHRVREGGPDASLLSLEPQTGSEGVHLGYLFSHQAVHVVGPHGEGEYEPIWKRWLCQRFGDKEQRYKERLLERKTHQRKWSNRCLIQ